MRVPQLRLTTPCKNCPFRTDIPPFLRKDRAAGIAHETFKMGRAFNCHKTVDYSTGQDQGRITLDSINCAGSLILAKKINRPSQLAQIAERMGLWSPASLNMRAPVFDTVQQFVDAQK